MPNLARPPHRLAFEPTSDSFSLRNPPFLERAAVIAIPPHSGGERHAIDVVAENGRAGVPRTRRNPNDLRDRDSSHCPPVRLSKTVWTGESVGRLAKYNSCPRTVSPERARANESVLKRVGISRIKSEENPVFVEWIAAFGRPEPPS